MKRILLLVVAGIFTLTAYSQISLTTAPDFTVTSIEGEVINLYEKLDAGQHVVLDMMGYWCGPCCDVAPEIKALYEAYGCNTGDVFYLSVDDVGSDQLCENFEVQCNSVDGAPMCSGTTGGGAAVHQMYNPAAVPTIVLIAPDRSIVDNDIWPNVTQEANQLSAANGIMMQSCVSGVAPTAAFTSSLENLTIIFTQNSEEAAEYSWNFGDGNTSDEESPSHTFSENGTYDVCLTVTNDFGSDEECLEITIGVPSTSFEASTNDLNVTFVNGTTDGVTYSWDFGDGNSSSNENPDHTYAADGTYEVCLTATGASGIDEVCQDVTVTMTVGIIDNAQVNLFDVFPNPTKGNVTVNMNLVSGDYFLKVFNSTGQIAFEQNFNNSISVLEIDLSQFAEGYYFVQLTNESKIIANQKLTVLK